MEIEPRTSEYNEAAYKMRRIDQLQSIINMCSLNLEGKYITDIKEFLYLNGKYNYEIKFDCLLQLFAEGAPRYEKTERDDVILYKEILESFMEKNPVHSIVTLGNGYEKIILNKAELKILKKYLSDFELLVRSFNSKHGFEGKDQSNPSRAIVSN